MALQDQDSLRTMLAVVDYLRRQRGRQRGHQQGPASTDRLAGCPPSSMWQQPLTPWSGSSSSAAGTVCDSNFWLELNYLEVAKAAQSCSAHFTALLYTEIYVDKLKANMEDSHRWASPPSSAVFAGRAALSASCRSRSRATRRLTFEDASQTFSVSSLTKKSVEDTDISLQVGSPSRSCWILPSN